MKNILTALIFLVSYGLSAQDFTEVRTYNSILEIGEYLNFGAGSIKFKEVISDSRCPREVTCIWAGEAKVLVEIYKNNNFLKEQVITIGAGKIPLNFSDEGLHYNLTGLVLAPYPNLEADKEEIKYILHMSINEIIDRS